MDFALCVAPVSENLGFDNISCSRSVGGIGVILVGTWDTIELRLLSVSWVRLEFLAIGSVYQSFVNA